MLEDLAACLTELSTCEFYGIFCFILTSFDIQASLTTARFYQVLFRPISGFSDNPRRIIKFYYIY